MASSTQGGSKRFLGFFGLLLTAFVTYFIVAGSGVFVYQAAAGFANGLTLIGLAFTLESLARCLMLPVSAQLGDKFGRKKLFIVGMIGFIACIGLSAFPPSMELFVLFRALSGLCWGLFMATGIAMVSDIFGVEESPKRIGLYQSAVLLSLVIGSPLAGAIADTLSWNMEFVIAIPLLVIALVLVIAFVPKQEQFQSSPLDIAGIIALAVALIPFSLCMSWGGSSYAWTDPIIMGLLAIFAIGLVAFVIVERKAQAPIFPANLLSNRNFLMMLLMAFFFSLWQCTGNYVPTYMSMVLGTSATVAGSSGVLGMIVSVFGSAWIGNYVGKKGKFKGLLAVFAFLTALSGLLYLFVSPTCPWWLFYVVGTIAGAANCLLQTVPNTYPHKALDAASVPTALALVQFAGAVANTVGSGVFGAVLNVSIDMVFNVSIVLAIPMIICFIVFRDKAK